MKRIISIIFIIFLLLGVFFIYKYYEYDIQYHIVTTKLEKANYCKVQNDCSLIASKSPFGCHVYVNKKETEDIFELITNFDDTHIYECPEKHEVKCIEQTCMVNWVGAASKIVDIKKYPEKEGIKKNELVVHFDYPVIAGSNIHKKIKNWGEILIDDRKKKYLQLEKKTGGNLHFSFEMYENEEILSIVYKMKENYPGNHPVISSKVFSIGKNGKSIEKSFIEEGKEKELKKKIIQKLTEKEIGYFQENIDTNIDTYLSRPKIYFDKERVHFLFDTYEIAPYSEGSIDINFYFAELEDTLSPEIFPEIKKKQELEAKIQKEREQIKKQEERRRREEQKKQKQIYNDIVKNDGKKYIALTFDDGPNRTLTPKLLNILKKYNIKATFFVLGKNISYFPTTFTQVYNEGHEIGNHSWDHANLKNLSDEEIQQQIEKTDNEIIKRIGEKPKYLRPPYGSFDQRVQNISEKTIIMWNVDSKDRKNRDIEKNIEHVKKDVKNGSIILFHDIHEESVNTIEPLKQTLQSEGYHFLTISELLIRSQTEDFSQKACYGAFDCR